PRPRIVLGFRTIDRRGNSPRIRAGRLSAECPNALGPDPSGALPWPLAPAGSAYHGAVDLERAHLRAHRWPAHATWGRFSWSRRRASGQDECVRPGLPVQTPDSGQGSGRLFQVPLVPRLYWPGRARPPELGLLENNE